MTIKYFNLDPEPNVLIDIIYSQTSDEVKGELVIEFDPVSSQLSLLTFVDISSLYIEK